jgi:heat shock protein HslJ
MAILLSASIACGPGEPTPEPIPEPTAEPEPQGPEAPYPTPEQLANLTYDGIRGRSVTLVDGAHADETPPDGMPAVNIQLLEDMTVFGNLDGAPGDEAAVMLADVSGTSVHRTWLSVVTMRSGQPESLGVVVAAEREQLRLMSVSDRWVRLELVDYGPDDPECCPTQLWAKEWGIVEGKLAAVSAAPTEELSMEALGGYKWLLTRMEASIAAPETPEINILFKDRGFKGKSGCTHYFGELTEPSPGEIGLGTIGLINRSCAPEIMAIESDYLGRLRKVSRYGFWRGSLVLAYEADDGFRQLVFARRPWPEDPPEES